MDPIFHDSYCFKANIVVMVVFDQAFGFDIIIIIKMAVKAESLVKDLGHQRRFDLSIAVYLTLLRPFSRFIGFA